MTWSKIGDANLKYARLENSIVINGKVYCGGNDFDYIVYCYDPSQDNWTTLPPLPVRRFGLGQVNGELVAVGGMKSDSRSTNEVYTYDEQSKQWKQTIPPMPTARHSPGVLSLQSALVVAGGAYIELIADMVLNEGRSSNVVEIFKADTSQWYTTDPLPTACYDISLVAIGNTCYVLGGYKDPSYYALVGYKSSRLNQTLYASVNDLLHNAVPAVAQTSNSTTWRLCKSPAWKTLTNTVTPKRITTALQLGKILITLNGDKIHMYVPSTESWNCIGDLPFTNAVAVNLSSQEILLFAKKAVYKSTLKYLTI